MRGEEDRDCRASGGGIKEGQARRNVKREFRGAQPNNTPDGMLSRGSGIFREDGGAVAPDREDGGAVKRKKGGRVARAAGGLAISGGGKKPSMGRSARARGGGVGADLHPTTHRAGTGPKQGHMMPDSEREPPCD